MKNCFILRGKVSGLWSEMHKTVRGPVSTDVTPKWQRENGHSPTLLHMIRNAQDGERANDHRCDTKVAAWKWPLTHPSPYDQKCTRRWEGQWPQMRHQSGNVKMATHSPFSIWSEMHKKVRGPMTTDATPKWQCENGHSLTLLHQWRCSAAMSVTSCAFPLLRRKRHTIFESLERLRVNFPVLSLVCWTQRLEARKTASEKGPGILRLGFWHPFLPWCAEENIRQPSIARRHHRQHFITKSTILKDYLFRLLHVSLKAQGNSALLISWQVLILKTKNTFTEPRNSLRLTGFPVKAVIHFRSKDDKISTAVTSQIYPNMDILEG